MKRVAVVTSARAEYGILTPIIRRIEEDPELELDLIVTGMHLSEKYGHSIDDIIEDGFYISHRIPILDEENSPYGISVTMANALKGFAECFRDDRPDALIVLGDRTEMLPIVAAALNEHIMVSHIHGGEITEGAIDDCVRHAITKMSYLHFTSTEEYKNRVIQLGEDPKRVFNVGALGVENVLTQKLMSEKKLRKDLSIPEGVRFVVVTFHPVTMENGTIGEQIKEICDTMNADCRFFYLITGSNSDTGGEIANRYLQRFANVHSNAVFVQNLGLIRYLSAVKYASFVLGNSSSGIIECPSLGTPTINIGARQKGRIMPKTVICCNPEKKEILKSIEEAINMECKPDYTYGKGNTSVEIIKIIKQFLNSVESLEKHFWDINGKDKRYESECSPFSGRGE